jgi:hypothetical protein
VQSFSLVKIRVVQRNLVYLIGLAPSLADEEVRDRKLLSRHEYIGQYGPIKKLVINKANAYNHPAGLSYSAYVTFTCEEDAAKCIKALTGFSIEGRELSATYGTTKYCSYFLKNIRCPKADCLYLHEFGAPEDSLTRDDIQQSSQIAHSTSLMRSVSIVSKAPEGTVFPSAYIVRLRNFSLDVSPIELLITEPPRRKNSRYNFVQESEETPGEVPSYITEIMQTNSPLKETARVFSSSISSILAPNSPERWMTDLIEPCYSFSEETVVVRAKAALTH